MAFVYTGRLKRYPNGSLELLTASRPLWADEKQTSPFRLPKLPTLDAKLLFESDMIDGPAEGGLHWTHDEDGNPLVSPEKAKNNLNRAMRRAKTKVRDIALCTPFQYFVTLTLDKTKVDRYDMDAITKLLNNWLSNQVRNHGLSYVLVPERHKDGAVHFHGFFNGALAAIDSGHKDREGHVVYNLPAWTLGFTTAIALYGDYAKAVNYVCKYVGKQLDSGGWHDPHDCKPGAKIGGRWYYSGGQLGKPEITYCDVTNEDALTMPGAYAFDVEAAALSMVMVRLQDDISPIGAETEVNHDSETPAAGADGEADSGDAQADVVCGGLPGLPLETNLQTQEVLEMYSLQTPAADRCETSDLTFLGLSSPPRTPFATSALASFNHNITPIENRRVLLT